MLVQTLVYGREILVLKDKQKLRVRAIKIDNLRRINRMKMRLKDSDNMRKSVNEFVVRMFRDCINVLEGWTETGRREYLVEEKKKQGTGKWIICMTD